MLTSNWLFDNQLWITQNPFAGKGLNFFLIAKLAFVVGQRLRHRRWGARVVFFLFFFCFTTLKSFTQDLQLCVCVCGTPRRWRRQYIISSTLNQIEMFKTWHSTKIYINTKQSIDFWYDWLITISTHKRSQTIVSWTHTIVSMTQC